MSSIGRVEMNATLGLFFGIRALKAHTPRLAFDLDFALARFFVFFVVFLRLAMPGA